MLLEKDSEIPAIYNHYSTLLHYSLLIFRIYQVLVPSLAAFRAPFGVAPRRLENTALEVHRVEVRHVSRLVDEKLMLCFILSFSVLIHIVQITHQEKVFFLTLLQRKLSRLSNFFKYLTLWTILGYVSVIFYREMKRRPTSTESTPEYLSWYRGAPLYLPK